jgi:hypothetical protein
MAATNRRTQIRSEGERGSVSLKMFNLFSLEFRKFLFQPTQIVFEGFARLGRFLEVFQPSLDFLLNFGVIITD